MIGLSESQISKNADEKSLHKAFYDLRKKCVHFQNKYKTTLISYDDFEELQTKLLVNTTVKTEFSNSYTKWLKEDNLQLLDWYKNGRNMNEIINSLGRTEGAIESRILKLRLDQFQYDFSEFVKDIATEFKISKRLFRSRVDLILDRKRYLFLKENLDN